MSKKRLAIIGGGASAVLLLVHLNRKENANELQIDVYDRTGNFARGIAYSTPHLCHLLNVRASNMSALADDPDHFADWASHQGYHAQDFVPRKLYGDYLAEQMQAAQRSLSIYFCHENVVESRGNENNTYDVETSSGVKNYDIVVQATGNCVALRPPMSLAVDGYHDSPWQTDYTALKNKKRIALIGSGLSAVDAVLSLHMHDYTGEIVMISRHALLPGEHVKSDAYPLFMNALPDTVLQALTLVRQEVKKIDAPWQAVIDSLRPLTNPLWSHWPETERRKFMKRMLTYWNVHRHRMAPQIAQTIRGIEAQGMLRRLATPVHAVLPGPVVSTGQGDVAVDAVINCLGYRYQEYPLAASYQLGPACFGPLFETTAIPEIRAQVALLAGQITR